jgi:hypothetical protein
MDTPTENALEKIHIPEVVDYETIRSSLAPSIDKLIVRADGLVPKIAANIKDEESIALAVREADLLRDDGKDLLEKWREEFYIKEYYRPGETRRELFDSRLTRIKTHIKTLMNGVADCKERMKREARLAKERADAEARRQQEEADRLAREAEEAARRAREAVEAEKRRKLEAEEAEKRRVIAEQEAKERREREAREAAAAETQRKMREEEEARIKHAEVAHAEGNGADKVDTILESPMPISSVLGKAEQAPDPEAVRLEQENARRVADEKAAREKAEAEEADRKLKEAEAEAFRAKEASAHASQVAAAAAAAAASVPDKVVDTGTTSVVRYKWDLESDGTEKGDADAVLAILQEIVAGRAPLSYCGYDPKHPEKWRPSMIGEDVTVLKDRFKCRGIRAYPQVDEQQKRRVGGRR